MSLASKINDFLDQTGFFYLATVDGTQPKLRPLGAHLEKDGHVYFGIGSHKNVYRQILNNPLVEIVAYTNGQWLRYTGKVVFVDDSEVSEFFLSQHPELRKIYNAQTGNKLKPFYLENSTALLIDMRGNTVEITE